MTSVQLNELLTEREELKIKLRKQEALLPPIVRDAVHKPGAIDYALMLYELEQLNYRIYDVEQQISKP